MRTFYCLFHCTFFLSPDHHLVNSKKACAAPWIQGCIQAHSLDNMVIYHKIKHVDDDSFMTGSGACQACFQHTASLISAVLTSLHSSFSSAITSHYRQIPFRDSSAVPSSPSAGSAVRSKSLPDVQANAIRTGQQKLHPPPHETASDAASKAICARV